MSVARKSIEDTERFPSRRAGTVDDKRIVSITVIQGAVG